MSPRICKSRYPSLVRLFLVNKKVAIPAPEFGKVKVQHIFFLINVAHCCRLLVFANNCSKKLHGSRTLGRTIDIWLQLQPLLPALQSYSNSNPPALRMTKVLLLATDKNLSRVDTTLNTRVRLSLPIFLKNVDVVELPNYVKTTKVGVLFYCNIILDMNQNHRNSLCKLQF